MNLPRSRSTWVMIGFFAIGGYLLWAEHSAHLVPYLPYLILLACPLMHVFMHGGHGHGGHGHSGGAKRQDGMTGDPRFSSSDRKQKIGEGGDDG